MVGTLTVDPWQARHMAHDGYGSKATVWQPVGHFRSAPNSGHSQRPSTGLKSATSRNGNAVRSGLKTPPVILERCQSRSGPSFWKSRLAKTVSEPFIVGYPTRIARQRQLLCLELCDRFAPGPAIGEICLERLACLGLLPVQCRCRDQYQRSIGVAVWGQSPAIDGPIRSRSRPGA